MHRLRAFLCRLLGYEPTSPDRAFSVEFEREATEHGFHYPRDIFVLEVARDLEDNLRIQRALEKRFGVRVLILAEGVKFLGVLRQR